ncbi:MAG: glycosyltransferase family 4 protein [Chthoniobacterales bacterium]
METTSPKRSSAPLHIALDARYVREKPSGIGAYVQALVERLPGLSPADHFYFWAHRLARRPLSAAPNTSEITVRPAPASPWPLLWPQRYASFDEVDLFHSPHNMMPRNIPCASVVTIHDVMSIERPDLHLQGLERLVKSKYYQQAVWRALREATLLIAPTQASADRVCVLEPKAASRLTVIWQCPDACFQPPEDFGAAQERASLITGDAAPYLLLVGANAPTKRHAWAIAAFAATVPQPWRLVLLQRQRGRGELVRLAHRLGVFDRLIWLEAVERHDVVTLIQAAGALLQPSIYEGFGLPVLEAMACGCPVVASDIAPLREITDGAALLFPAHDPEKFATVLREVTASPELRRSLRQQSLGRARHFPPDRCARETLQAYHEAAERRR